MDAVLGEIETLRESVERLDVLGRPIERARMNVELGAALRRTAPGRAQE